MGNPLFILEVVQIFNSVHFIALRLVSPSIVAVINTLITPAPHVGFHLPP